MYFKKTLLSHVPHFTWIFLKLIYLSVIKLGTTKEEEANFPFSLECFCSGTLLHLSSANSHSDEHVIAKPRALWECRGDMVSVGARLPGR